MDTSPPPVLALGLAASLDSASLAALAVIALVAAAAVGWLVASSSAARRSATASDPAPTELLDARMDHLTDTLRHDLDRLERVVSSLGQRSSEQLGQVGALLQMHADATASLASTASGLREALANPKARGQWGERMAEDVLRLAGMVEHVNYRKQTAVEGEARGIPDFTFFLPKQHVLHMDVKFPVAAYLRALDAGSEHERVGHREQFLRDVRLRVRELARRDYAGATEGRSVDHVLLFLPNESVAGYVFEHDPAIVDDALRQRVVICTPVTLYAYLGLVRQAFDAFMIESTSDRVLSLLARFDTQWTKYAESLEGVQRRFDAVQREPRPAHRDEAPRPRTPAARDRCASARARPAGGGAVVRRRTRRDRPGPRRPVGRVRGRPSAMSRAESDPMSQPSFDFDPPEGDAPEREVTYSVRELVDAVNGTLRARFGHGLWIRGEIQGWNERGAHAYFRLVEEGAQGRCVVNVSLFAPSRARLRPLLERHRLRLGDGVKVRIHGHLDLYGPSGQLGLKMSGLDPRFTLGEMAIEREDVVRRLVAAGLYDANRARRLSPVPLRIGLVTSRSSAAYADFVHEIERSGFRFRLHVVDVRVQGADAVPMISHAIRRLGTT